MSKGSFGSWRASLASGEPFLHETRVRRADGVYRWMLHHKIAVRDEHGNIVKWHGSSIDIEDRKRAEVALQQSQFYLAEGQRLAHMGSWVFNAAGFEYWSPELFRIYGLDPRGTPPAVEAYLALVHPDDRAFMETRNYGDDGRSPRVRLHKEDCAAGWRDPKRALRGCSGHARRDFPGFSWRRGWMLLSKCN